MDLLSSEMIALKGCLGNIVELVDNWIVSIGREEEKIKILESVREEIKANSDKLPAKSAELCLESLAKLMDKDSDTASLAYQKRIKDMFAHEIDKLNIKLDQFIERVGTLIKDIRSPENPAKRVIMAQEEERKRISREIHDGPAQSLANLTMSIDFCMEMADNPEVIRGELASLKDCIIRSLKDIRRFIFDLRPMALDDLGLVPTLEQFTTSFKLKTGLSIHIDVSGERKQMSGEKELTVFRVVQEAVNNAFKHSSANSIHVFLSFDRPKNKLNAVVKDNGSGFDLAGIKKNYSTLGKMGLISMEERILLSGGEFEIITGKSDGTIVSFWIPL